MNQENVNEMVASDNAAEGRGRRPTVTDDMLSAALAAYEDVYEGQLDAGAERWTDNRRQAMHAALRAALAELAI